jgi:single-stranded DNA-specific DHH superfamily exonuclease
MLNNAELDEIREHLEKAQNPLFFFDNDNDGLCSFLLLQRKIKRGKGVAIRSFPDLNESYFRRVVELNPDYIFILDKPSVSMKFLEKCKERNLPVIWIDHHMVDKPEGDFFHYYNPYHTNKTSEPVSFIAHKIVNNPKDSWISMIGCISDCFMPDFYDQFKKDYPDLVKETPTGPFDLLYTSGIGKISRILDFSLKDTTTNVVSMMKFMMKVNSPFDILEEDNKTQQILKRYEQINTKYQNLIERARIGTQKNLLYFQYGGGLSLSANLANQLSYEYPGKVIIVAYINGDIANVSLRGKGDIRDVTLKSIAGIEGATGGGHIHATGAKMLVGSLPQFKENIEKLLKEN